MKAQRRLGLAYSWPRVSTVFLIDVALLAAASHWPGTPTAARYAWWVGVGLAALVTLLVLVTYRRLPLGSALVAQLRNRTVDPEELLAAGLTTATDHRRRFGRDVVGIREHDGALVTIIAVDTTADAVPGRHHRDEPNPATLPIGVVAAGLRQFDVRLDHIDVVSVGSPQHRRTWLVLRMDPQRNVAAVATRDSLAATFAAVTERLAQDLDGRQVIARPLTGEEFAEMDDAVLAGLQPADVRPRLRFLKHTHGESGYATSFWVTPRDITAETLDQLWLLDARATVLTLRLTPRRGGRTEVSAFVRYHSDEQLAKDTWAGLNRLTGSQLAAVRASLPAPVRRPPLVPPARDLADDPEQLAFPLGDVPQYPVSEVGAQA